MLYFSLRSVCIKWARSISLLCFVSPTFGFLVPTVTVGTSEVQKLGSIFLQVSIWAEGRRTRWQMTDALHPSTAQTGHQERKLHWKHLHGWVWSSFLPFPEVYQDVEPNEFFRFSQNWSFDICVVGEEEIRPGSATGRDGWTWKPNRLCQSLWRTWKELYTNLQKATTG